MRHLVLVSALALSTASTHAQVPAQLGKCIVANLSPADRQAIARWVFTSIAMHPALKALAVENPSAARDAAQQIGPLFTRVMRDACSEEAGYAAKAGGPPVVPMAINFFTQLGIQELMTNKTVLATHSSFSQYADKEGIDRITHTK